MFLFLAGEEIIEEANSEDYVMLPRFSGYC